MHELSVVQDLIKLCETNAMNQNCIKVTRVEVKVGKLSGVEPHYLQSTFDCFKEGSLCSEAQLILNIEDISVKCLDCGYIGVIEAGEFTCPKCGGRNLEITGGEDLILQRLEME